MIASASAPTILVLDDDQGCRDLCTDLLDDAGYRVLTAPTAPAALDLLATERPAVLLLDLRLPDMDAASFLAAYRQHPEPHAAIVVFSAASDAHAHAERLRAAAVVTKPFHVATLLSCVERFVPVAVPAL